MIVTARHSCTVCLATLLLLLAVATARGAADVVFPLRASPDGRYLVDSQDRPVFVHADTAWLAPRHLTLAEWEEYLDRRKAQGFNTILIHAISKEVGPQANHNGDEPFARFDPPPRRVWDGHDPREFSEDMTRPNEPYWRHFDPVVAAAARRGLLLGISTSWSQWGGKDRDGWRFELTEASAPGYGRFLGERYGRFANIMWILGGDANPIEITHAVAALGTALKQAAPQHLLTVHNKPEFATRAFYDGQPWVDVNLALHLPGDLHPRAGRVESSRSRKADPARRVRVRA